MPHADLVTCPRCRKPRPSSATAGLCPWCLLDNALGGETDVSYSFVSETHSVVLETLAATFGAIPRILLPDTEGHDGGSPLVQPSSAEIPAPADRTGRVQVLGEIAPGPVWALPSSRGVIPTSGDLAVKVLLDARFRERRRSWCGVSSRKRQIAGQLQHPGVVPVYANWAASVMPGLVFHDETRRGAHASAQLLADRQSPERPSDPGSSSASSEQVAQTRWPMRTLGGVIHAAIAQSPRIADGFGSFGEVQVMDWGLAKVLPRGGAVDDATAGRDATPVEETVIATARSGADPDADLSRAGSVLGTPSYMAPEQARGEVAAVDERADVFALGSILCEILTGRPAFRGRTSGEIQRKAARGDLSDASARLGACGVDADLVALARDCLAGEPDDRPRDAGVVAERLAAYLTSVQERLHASELAHAAEVARTEEAVRTAEAAEARSRAEWRARRLTGALAATAIVITLLGAGGWVWVRQQRAARSLATAREVDAAALWRPRSPGGRPRRRPLVTCKRGARRLRRRSGPSRSWRWAQPT